MCNISEDVSLLQCIRTISLFLSLSFPYILALVYFLFISSSLHTISSSKKRQFKTTSPLQSVTFFLVVFKHPRGDGVRAPPSFQFTCALNLPHPIAFHLRKHVSPFTQRLQQEEQRARLLKARNKLIHINL